MIEVAFGNVVVGIACPPIRQGKKVWQPKQRKSKSVSQVSPAKRPALQQSILFGEVVSLLKLIQYGFVSVSLGLIMWNVLKPIELKGDQHEINLDALREAGL